MTLEVCVACGHLPEDHMVDVGPTTTDDGVATRTFLLAACAHVDEDTLFPCGCDLFATDSDSRQARDHAVYGH